MEKEIEITGKKVVVKEMTYIQAVTLEECKTQTDKIKKIIEFSTNLSVDEIEKLPFKEGVKLQKLINEVNGFAATFQKPVTEEKEN